MVKFLGKVGLRDWCSSRLVTWCRTWVHPDLAVGRGRGELTGVGTVVGPRWLVLNNTV